MSVELSWEQCRESQDCRKPAQLLAAGRPANEPEDGVDGYVSREGAAWLAGLWAA
jgi:hypothetical protein